MHVLVGCGLGGGSLVNAGVSLRPDARVFADPVWPGQIRQDGLLDEGFRRAEHWLRPMSDPLAGQHPKFRALAAAGAALGAAPVAPRVAVSFEDTVNPAGIAQPACTRCGDCCAGCNVGAKNTVALTYLPDAVAPRRRAVHPCSRQPRQPERRWRLGRARRPGRWRGGRAPHHHRRSRDPVRRHAGFDRNPAALARARPCGIGPARPALFRQRRHHRLRLRCQHPGQLDRRRLSGEGRTSGPSARRSRASSRSRTRPISPTKCASRKARCRRRWRRSCR